MTCRLFKYAQWLTRKRFLTSKLYKSANADIVVGSYRHIARPLRPITCCCRGFGAIISPNRTDWCIRMQPMSLTCCCIQIILYVAKCLFFLISTKTQSQDISSNIENHKLFYVTWCMHRCTSVFMLHVYQRNFNRKQMFYSCVEALASIA